METEASGRSMTAAEYVREVLERMFGGPGRSLVWLTATREEWLERFNAWMDSHGPALPPLSEEGTSREGMYGERG